MLPFSRYVALGDSFTEGLDDPYPRGGYRGWADRLAERLAAAQPSFSYANLAIRGRKIAGIHEEQLEPALALRPDLASVMGGTNDILRPKVMLDEVAAHMESMQSALAAQGATVISFTLPNVASVIPVARIVRERMRAFNQAMREVAARTGALLIDLEEDVNSAHPAVWSEDRLHANSLGHSRIAVTVAEALGVPIPEADRIGDLDPLAPRPRHRLLLAEVAWARQHFIPWIGRRLRGRSSGDDVLPKRPEMAPMAESTATGGVASFAGIDD